MYMRDLLCCFFNDTATTEIYTLSLHDALPILEVNLQGDDAEDAVVDVRLPRDVLVALGRHEAVELADEARRQVSVLRRSEEHTSELQSRQYLVCRLLLEKKNKLTCRPNICHVL